MIEYKVRPITRYVVTRYETHPDYAENQGAADARSVAKGEYQNADVAFEVATALCKAEHDVLGYGPGDERIKYPVHPHAIPADCVAS